jgi:Protein of unknown function (DUF3808)
MRTIVGIYRQLGKFIEVMDAEAEARGEGPEDKSIDNHFRTGVYLGNGFSNLILSLIPSRILTIIEMFGYKGDRTTGLQLLAKSGGWTKESEEPSVGVGEHAVSLCVFGRVFFAYFHFFTIVEEEGVRRSICDMGLLIFHLVLSSFTFEGVDIDMAQKILDWNLKRYSNGDYSHCFRFGLFVHY